MSVAITFCDQTEHERRENKHSYSLFRWSEAESLPHFIEPEAPDPLQLAKVFKVNSDTRFRIALQPVPPQSPRDSAAPAPFV
jgi:hypothetical protein